MSVARWICMFWLFGLGAALLHVELGGRDALGPGAGVAGDSVDLANVAGSTSKRSTSMNVRQNNYYYWMRLNVGNPIQQIQGFIDTGSSDFWVATPGTCNTAPNDQLRFGTLEINCNYTYNTTYSNTLSQNQSQFEVSYVSGNTASGFYGQELLTVNGMAIEQINLGVAMHATASPVIGISYPYGESCVIWNSDLTLAPSSCTPYSNLPIQLKEKGVISTVAYSLWLNHANNGTGSITFGGVDHSLYSGTLTKLPIEKEVFSFDSQSGQVTEYPAYTRLLVALTGISITAPDGRSESIMSGAIPALLDSGTPDCMVPSSIVAAFYEVFDIYHGSTDDQSIGCGVPENYTITFDLRGVQVNVSLVDFIRPLLTDGQESYDSQGDMLCSPGFESLDNTNYAILGQNVLASLYLVVDMEANEVALAPAKYGPGNSSLESITNGIPSAVLAPSYSNALNLHLSVTSQADFTASFSQATDVADGPHTGLQTVLSGSPTFTHAIYSSASGGLSVLGDDSVSTSTSTSGASGTGASGAGGSDATGVSSASASAPTTSSTVVDIGDSPSTSSSSAATTTATVVNVSGGSGGGSTPWHRNAGSRTRSGSRPLLVLLFGFVL